MTSQEQWGLNKVKASVCRRWLVIWAYSPGTNHPFDGWSWFTSKYNFNQIKTTTLYSMKIKEQTRKLAVGCSRYCFEVVDMANVVWRDFRRVLLYRFQGFKHINLSQMMIDEETKQGQNDAYCCHWDYIDFPTYLRIKENSRRRNHLNQKLV